MNFNFQSNDLENVQVKDPAEQKSTDNFLLIKEETKINNDQDQDICPSVLHLEEAKEVAEAPAKKAKKGGFSFKIDIADSNIKD